MATPVTFTPVDVSGPSNEFAFVTPSVLIPVTTRLPETTLSATTLDVFANPVIVTLPVAPLTLILLPAVILVTMPVKLVPLP